MAPHKANYIKCCGNSMTPILLHEDVVYFKKITFAQIDINDIIIAKSKSTYITHRVIFKGKKHLITKGDNNFQIDPFVYPKNIVGRVHQIKRNGKLFHPDTMYLMQSTQYFEAIKICISELNKQNIPYVLLKGLILHLYYSKTHPRRRYADYDILIEQKNYQKVDQILRRLGYKKRDNSISPFQKKMMNTPVEVTYIANLNQNNPLFQVAVDVHFEPVFMMTQITRLDELYEQEDIDKLGALFFKKSRTVTIHGFGYNILSPEHLIVYLALHFFHHNFRGIHRIELLDKIIQKVPKRDTEQVWDEVATILNDFQLSGFVYGSFLTMQTYFKTEIPHSFFSHLQMKSSQIVYTRSYLRHNSVFDIKTRTEEGTQLFRNLFFLSPKTFASRVRVFFKPIVIYMVLWSMYSKLKLETLRHVFKTYRS